MRFLTGFFLFLLIVPGHIRAQPENESPIILFWHYYADERADILADMAAEFNADNPSGITVEVQYYPAYDHLHDGMLSGLLTGNLPHVVMVRNYHAALYQLSDSLVDLTPYIEKDLNPTDFYSLFWNQDIFNGQQLGLPLTRAAESLYINMDMLRELGYESAPQTRDDLASIACDFYEHERKAAFDIRLDASFLIALTYPDEAYDSTAHIFHLNASGFYETLLFLQNLMSQGCIENHIGQYPDELLRFASGQTLFYINSSGAYPYVQQLIGDFFAAPFTLAIVPIPSQEMPVANFYGSSLSMVNHSPEENAAAWEFLKWLAQKEQVERWSRANNAFPARQDVALPEHLRAFSADRATWIAEPGMAGYDLIRDEIGFAMRDILLTGMDIPRRLQYLNRTANEIREVFALE